MAVLAEISRTSLTVACTSTASGALHRLESKVKVKTRVGLHPRLATEHFVLLQETTHSKG
jgi:hypothetical protein